MRLNVLHRGGFYRYFVYRNKDVWTMFDYRIRVLGDCFLASPHGVYVRDGEKGILRN